MGSNPSAFSKEFQVLSCWSDLVLLPRKPNWEAYGKQAWFTGQLPGDFYRLPAVLSQLLHLANIWNRAESGPLPDHAEGQDVTEVV
jgi:hypothetical protein